MLLNLFISEDEEGNHAFITPNRAAQQMAAAPLLNKGRDTLVYFPSSLDLADIACQDVCRPAAVAETTRSHNEGKWLPMSRSDVKQSLPVFPEVLDEMVRSWKYHPCSDRNPFPQSRD